MQSVYSAAESPEYWDGRKKEKSKVKGSGAWSNIFNSDKRSMDAERAYLSHGCDM